MQINRVPLDPASERKLRDLFTSDPFLLFLQTLECDYEAKLHEAKIDNSQYLIDQTITQDAKDKLFEATKLRVALDVIQEHTESEREHFTIQVDL